VQSQICVSECRSTMAECTLCGGAGGAPPARCCGHSQCKRCLSRCDKGERCPVCFARARPFLSAVPRCAAHGKASECLCADCSRWLCADCIYEQFAPGAAHHARAIERAGAATRALGLAFDALSAAGDGALMHMHAAFRSAVERAKAPIEGDTDVVIDVAGAVGKRAYCKFDATVVASRACTASSITCRAPAHAAGSVLLAVSHDALGWSAGVAFRYVDRERLMRIVVLVVVVVSVVSFIMFIIQMRQCRNEQLRHRRNDPAALSGYVADRDDSGQMGGRRFV